MAIKEILQLGNPNLYKKSEKFTKEELFEISLVANDLRDTYIEFKKNYGYGKGIAAPQVNIHKRLIYMQLEKPLVLINPEIISKSSDTFESWERCMSLLGIIVKIHRYKSVKFEYLDLNWDKHELEFKDKLAILFQHEYDHLNGILTIMRPADKYSFSFTSEYDKFYKK